MPQVEIYSDDPDNHQPTILSIPDGKCGLIAKIIRPSEFYSLRESGVHLRRNKLIEKRKADAVKEALENVSHKSQNVAVAVTRLQASATALVTPGTPTTPTHENKFSQFIPENDLLALSGTKRRKSSIKAESSLTLGPMVGSNTSGVGRLSSLKV